MTPPATAPRVVFTDLDGTLLDADTYSPDLARPAVARLKAAGIPIVFCSAKTAAEQAPIRRNLRITDPYIVENGSAIVFDDGTRHVLGLPAQEIQRRLATIRASSGLDFRGFHEVSVATVAAVTGLALDVATFAQQRDYSATIFTPFGPDDLALFQTLCAENGLHAPSGGRFFTVTGARGDKGTAIKLMMGFFSGGGRIYPPTRHTTIGIGDSPNDVPMLAVVDRAYIVQRPDGTWHDRGIPTAVRVPAIGPAGWSWVVETELSR